VDYIFDTLRVAVPAIISGNADGIYLVIYDAQKNDELLERYVLEFDMDEMVHIVKEGNNRNASESKSRKRNNNNGTGNGTAKDREYTEREELEQKIQQLQRALRDSLLKIISLKGNKFSLGNGTKTRGRGRGRGQDSNSKTSKEEFSSSTTFKLCVHTIDDDQGQGQSQQMQQMSQNTSSTNNSRRRPCQEIEDALNEGTWMRSDSQSCEFQPVQADPTIIIERDDDDDGDDDDDEGIWRDNGNRYSSSNGEVEVVTRPLKTVHVPSCGLQMKILMELPKR